MIRDASGGNKQSITTVYTLHHGVKIIPPIQLKRLDTYIEQQRNRKMLEVDEGCLFQWQGHHFRL